MMWPPVSTALGDKYMYVQLCVCMYADDTVIYYTGSETSTIRECLQEDLKRVEEWLLNSGLILSQRKTKGLLFHARLCSASYM